MLINLPRFTLYSGGAVGSDITWCYAGKEHFHNLAAFQCKHYYVKNNQTPYGNIAIDVNEAKKADDILNEVNSILNRKFPTNNEYVNNLLRRNYWQIKNTEAVYAIANIEDNIVQGGTGWAVHMAILKEIPVFVFDQNKNKWFTYFINKFIEYTDPIFLKMNFTGIGTRELQENGIKAINDVYKNTVKLLKKGYYG